MTEQSVWNLVMPFYGIWKMTTSYHVWFFVMKQHFISVQFWVTTLKPCLVPEMCINDSSLEDHWVILLSLKLFIHLVYKELNELKQLNSSLLFLNLQFCFFWWSGIISRSKPTGIMPICKHLEVFFNFTMSVFDNSFLWNVDPDVVFKLMTWIKQSF